jgi:hypothetical protein
VKRNVTIPDGPITGGDCTAGVRRPADLGLGVVLLVLAGRAHRQHFRRRWGRWTEEPDG